MELFYSFIFEVVETTTLFIRFKQTKSNFNLKCVSNLFIISGTSQNKITIMTRVQCLVLRWMMTKKMSDKFFLEDSRNI